MWTWQRLLIRFIWKLFLWHCICHCLCSYLKLNRTFYEFVFANKLYYKCFRKGPLVFFLLCFFPHSISFFCTAHSLFNFLISSNFSHYSYTHLYEITWYVITYFLFLPLWLLQLYHCFLFHLLLPFLCLMFFIFEIIRHNQSGDLHLSTYMFPSTCLFPLRHLLILKLYRVKG